MQESNEPGPCASRKAVFGWMALVIALLVCFSWLAMLTGAPLGGGGQMLTMELKASTAERAQAVIKRWADDLGDPRLPEQKAMLDRNREEGLDWSDGVLNHPLAVDPSKRTVGALKAWLFKTSFAVNGAMSFRQPDVNEVGWRSSILAALAWDDWFILTYVLLLGLTPFWSRLVFQGQSGGMIRRVLKWKGGWPVVAVVVLAGVLDAFFENRYIQNMVLAAGDASSSEAGDLQTWPLKCVVASWIKWIIGALASLLFLGAFRHLLAAAGWSGPLDLTRYLIEGVPARPRDWDEKGWDSTSDDAEIYGRWFASTTRSAFQFVSHYPELLVILLALFALVCGWGTSAFGIPFLFIDPDDKVRTALAGAGVGTLVAELGFLSCLLWSEEWMSWWPDESLIKDGKTMRMLANAGLVTRYLSNTITFQMSALVIAVLASRFSVGGFVFCVCAVIAATIWLKVFLCIARRSVSRVDAQRTTQYLKRMRRLASENTIRPEVMNLHVHAANLFLIAIVLLLIGFIAPDFLGFFFTTALLLCLGLHVVASLSAFLKFHGFISRMVLAPVAVFLVCYVAYTASSPVFSHFYHDKALLSHYASPVRVPVIAREDGLSVENQGIRNDVALANWRNRFPADKKPALVLLASEGGGIMASAWTTGVVNEIEEAIPGFMQHVRVVTGSSGGMVGAVHVISSLAGEMDKDATKPLSVNAESSPRGPRLFEATGSDSLLESVRWMVLRDLPNIVLRPILRGTRLLPNGDDYGGTWDRGEAIQARWEQSAADRGFRLDRTFGSIRSLEEAGAIPSLIVSPTSVEDGRQMLISNLDLRSMEGIDVNGDGLIESRSVITLRALFPDAMRELKLSTAARMTASFPFVSPAGELPTDPPLRLVDSGYNENYGVKLACLWVAQSREQLRDLVSRVIVVQVRSGLTTSSTRDHHVARAAPAFHRLSGLATPPTGILHAWSGTMVLSNDERMYLARHYFQNEYAVEVSKTDEKGQLVTARELREGPALEVVTFDCPYEASLSWHLTNEEKERLKKGVKTDPALKAKVKEGSPFDLGNRALGCTRANVDEALRQQVAENNERELRRLTKLLE